MVFTGEVCEVDPFLESYEPVNEIPVARCCTIWTCPQMSQEYLLVGDQMLLSGTDLPNSHINPNQIWAYGIDVNDDPFDSNRKFGINSKDAFIPLDTMGMIVFFESCMPTKWEEMHLQSFYLLVRIETQHKRLYVLKNKVARALKCI